MILRSQRGVLAKIICILVFTRTAVREGYWTQCGLFARTICGSSRSEYEQITTAPHSRATVHTRGSEGTSRRAAEAAEAAQEGARSRAKGTYEDGGAYGDEMEMRFTFSSCSCSARRRRTRLKRNRRTVGGGSADRDWLRYLFAPLAPNAESSTARGRRGTRRESSAHRVHRRTPPAWWDAPAAVGGSPECAMASALTPPDAPAAAVCGTPLEDYEPLSARHERRKSSEEQAPHPRMPSRRPARSHEPPDHLAQRVQRPRAEAASGELGYSSMMGTPKGGEHFSLSTERRRSVVRSRVAYAPPTLVLLRPTRSSCFENRIELATDLSASWRPSKPPRSHGTRHRGSR